MADQPTITTIPPFEDPKVELQHHHKKTQLQHKPVLKS